MELQSRLYFVTQSLSIQISEHISEGYLKHGRSSEVSDRRQAPHFRNMISQF